MLSASLANAAQSGMDDTPAEVNVLVFAFVNNGYHDSFFYTYTCTYFRVTIISVDTGFKEKTSLDYNLTDVNKRKVVSMREDQKAHRTRYIFQQTCTVLMVLVNFNASGPFCLEMFSLILKLCLKHSFELSSSANLLQSNGSLSFLNR